jgi:hypothetical protein
MHGCKLTVVKLSPWSLSFMENWTCLRGLMGRRQQREDHALHFDF